MGKFDGVSDEELIAVCGWRDSIEDYLMEKYKAGASESPGHVPHRRRYR